MISPFSKEDKQEMSWEEYLLLLNNYADSSWFPLSWDEHIIHVNKFGRMQFKALLPSSEIKIDREIFESLLNEIIYADGEITTEEKTRVEHLGLNQLAKDAEPIKETKLTRKIVSFQQQAYLFYELIQIAIMDKKLHLNEFEYLCDLGEVLGIANPILRYLNIFKDKIGYPKNKTHSPFVYIEEGTKEITKSFQHVSAQVSNRKENLQDFYRLWVKKISDIASKCSEYGCDQKITEQLKSHSEMLDKAALKLGLFGVTSSGKTALINALLGENLFPEKTLATTNIAVKVKYGSIKQAVVEFQDGRKEIWSGNSLAKQLHEATNEASNCGNKFKIDLITVEHPDFILPPYLELFDTPGINAEGHSEHEKIATERVLPQVDIVIYLTTVSNQIKQKDMDFIKLAKERLASDQKIIFVITGKGKGKADKGGKNIEVKGETAVSYLRKELDKKGITQEVASIVLIDNIWAQLGRLGYMKKWQQSGMPDLIYEMSFYYTILQENLLQLKIKQVISILENNIKSPLQAKLKENKEALEQKKSDLKSRIESISNYQLSNRVEIEHFINEAERKKHSLSIVNKPNSSESFYSAKNTIDNNSSDIMRFIQDKFYDYQKRFAEQFKTLEIKELSRREIDFNRLSIKSLSAKTKQVEQDKTGILSSVARFFSIGGKEIVDKFDPEGSFDLLNEHFKDIQNTIGSIIYDCKSILEKQFQSVLINQIEMLGAEQKELERVSLKSDDSYLSYIDTITKDLNYECHFLEEACKSQKSKKREPIKYEDSADSDNRFSEDVVSINQLPDLWSKYKNLSSKRGIIFVGGNRDKHLIWFKNIYKIQLSYQGDKDTPIWVGNSSQDFINKYSNIPLPADASFSTYFLSIPESINGTDNLFPNILEMVLQKQDWIIGIHVDINRISSGLSDIHKTVGKQLERLANMNKIFFWNLDMAYFEGSERLYELITDINDILNNHKYKNIPKFFGEADDMRWTYLMDIAVDWKHDSKNKRMISSAWQEKGLEYDRPFIPSILLELDYKYYKIVNPFRSLLDEVEKGYAEAEFEIGNYYFDKDVNKAFEFFLKAANQGHIEAEFKIGNAYYFGNGFDIIKDYNKAFEWFMKAAEQGHARAQFRVAHCFYYGNGVPKDIDKASEWFVKASECFIKIIEKSATNKREKNKAFEWLLKIAEISSHALIQKEIGNCYYYGKGIHQSYSKAFEWYMKAAEQGLVKAQYNVGYCYYYGKGTYKNRQEAFGWYVKAAEQGHLGAEKAIQKFFDFYNIKLRGSKQPFWS